MVVVISDDTSLGENISELLLIDTNKEVRLLSSYQELSYIPLSQIELITYCNGTDPGGENLHCYLLANDPGSTIPVIFLTKEDALYLPTDESHHYSHLQMPFEPGCLLSLLTKEVVL